MRGLRGQVALVTGAAQGIGEGIARRLAEEGMDVALADINGEAVKAAAAAIALDTGARTIAVTGDVSDEADARAMVRACADTFGGLTALVNNAGVDIAAAPAELSRAMWQRVHDVDLWGTMLMVREAESLLAVRGGSVVNIGSNHAIATVAGRAAYAAAKAGVVGLSRGLAIDLGPKRIRVNTILPGYIRTPIWRLWLDEAPDPEGLLGAIAKRHPVRRLGAPADVAGVVAFLCSDDAAFMTAATVVVDGGNTALLEYPLE
jgi:NAD(P)-dependent dehydrogenase (short-subunit alcohol dehydrogenase family)